MSEDLLEEVISFFEAATTRLQPVAAIDNPPPPSFDALVAEYDDEISVEGRSWAEEIYGHWHARRLEKSNRTLLPSLKFETGQETDDADAYVAFRRREVRQARKTRGRDAQVAEKLKKLRRELEDARQLVMTVNQRERMKREHIETERKVFEQRSELKRVKIQQGIKGEKGDDEDLLVYQRVCLVLLTKLKMRLTDFLFSLLPSPKLVEKLVLDRRPCESTRHGQKAVLRQKTTSCNCQISKRRLQRLHAASSKTRSVGTANGTNRGPTSPGIQSHHRPRQHQCLDTCRHCKRFSCRRLLLRFILAPRVTTTTRMSR